MADVLQTMTILQQYPPTGRSVVDYVTVQRDCFKSILDFLDKYSIPIHFLYKITQSLPETTAMNIRWVQIRRLNT